MLQKLFLRQRGCLPHPRRALLGAPDAQLQLAKDTSHFEGVEQANAQAVELRGQGLHAARRVLSVLMQAIPLHGGKRDVRDLLTPLLSAIVVRASAPAARAAWAMLWVDEADEHPAVLAARADPTDDGHRQRRVESSGATRAALVLLLTAGVLGRGPLHHNRWRGAVAASRSRLGGSTRLLPGRRQRWGASDLVPDRRWHDLRLRRGLARARARRYRHDRDDLHAAGVALRHGHNPNTVTGLQISDAGALQGFLLAHDRSASSDHLVLGAHDRYLGGFRWRREHRRKTCAETRRKLATRVRQAPQGGARQSVGQLAAGNDGGAAWPRLRPSKLLLQKPYLLQLLLDELPERDFLADESSRLLGRRQRDHGCRVLCLFLDRRTNSLVETSH
mmetsp:Transcript_33301/g.91825  ORF Transcript_33301/g.91825 Transcript_33301/m.91825 type:complete len:390 (-) Transcript_33301:301-1470(-)